MNKKQQLAYIALLQQILECQHVLQSLKIQLGKSSFYNPQSLFQKISKDKSKITIVDLRNYMSEKLTFNERQLYDIFEKFDWNRYGFITQEDFIKEITSFDQKAKIKNTNIDVTPQIQGFFVGLLAQIINRFRIIQVARKQVIFITPYNSFLHLDYLQKGIIGYGQIKKFFNQNDIELTQKQILLLLHGLRRRAYLDVNLEVWCQNLNPIQFGYYEGYNNSLQNEQKESFLKRSRHQEESLRRSRIESQRIQNQVGKIQRRRQAGLERSLQIQDRIKDQIIKHQENNFRLSRKALLQEDFLNRRNLEQSKRSIQQIYAPHLTTHPQLDSIYRHQRIINQNLQRNRRQREYELQELRRKRQHEQQLRIRKNLQIDFQARNNELNRKILEQRNKKQLQATQRQIDLQRIKDMQILKKTRQLNLEKQLEKTRLEIQQRRSRIQNQTRSNLNYINPIPKIQPNQLRSNPYARTYFL